MRFAQIYRGKILCFEEAESFEKLLDTFSPNNYWIDVTDIECGLGWEVSHTIQGELILTPPKPTPAPTFEALKSFKMSEARTLFEQKRDAIIWVDLPKGKFGFDTKAEDIVNFLSAKTASEILGQSEYRVWISDKDKVFTSFKPTDFETVFLKARESQINAYTWFEKVKTLIEKCRTKEELDGIILE